MKYKKPFVLLAASLTFMGVAACQGGSNAGSDVTEEAGMAAGKSTPAAGEANGGSPGKPTAPISISYEVIGNAFVGSPVSINVVVTSDRGPVNVHYTINDGSALMFQSGQVERLEIVDPSSGSVQQLSVVPQREGRLYVNVAAEIQATDGLTIRSMAIPIQVGAAPESATINGEMLEGADGETVISMPAQESN